MAGDHARRIQICPYGWEVFFLHAQHVDALPACIFHRRNIELVHNVCNRSQLTCCGHAAPSARYDRISPVFLNIGVDALIDEARLIIVDILAWPCCQKIEIERWSTLGAPTRCFPAQLLHDGRNGSQVLRGNQTPHIIMA